MIRILMFAPLLTMSVLVGSCADPAATEALRIDVERLRARVDEGKKERIKYGEGSVLNLLVSMRVASDEHTLAMLEQKSAALRWYPRFTYTVDGQTWKPPADTEVQLRVLEVELVKAQSEARAERARAARMGGLIGMIAQMNAELKAMPVAQLEYQMMALRHGYPIYLTPKPSFEELKK